MSNSANVSTTFVKGNGPVIFHGFIFCNKNNYYSLKLTIDLSRVKLNINQANPMPSDYLVVTKNLVYFVELKEVFDSNKFYLHRLKQQYRLTKLSQKSNIIKCLVIINFVKHNKLLKFIPGSLCSSKE